MAYNFSANQYEDGYQTKRLKNWEIPKWYPEPPKRQSSTTKFIADSRGHLLPGIPRCNPWSNYRGTWDLPKRITRQIADDLTAPTDRKSFSNRKRAPSNIKSQIEESNDQKLPALDVKEKKKNFLRRNKSCPALDLPLQIHEQVQNEFVERKTSTPNIQPGTLNKELKDLLKSPDPVEVDIKPCKATDALILPDAEDIKKEATPPAIETMATPKKIPALNEYPAFLIAKRYHDENLKHQPLPDVIDDVNYKSLVCNRHENPASGLKSPTITTAIGIKRAGTAGPTKCSKMKIYRPKTSIDAVKILKPDDRPKTSDPKKISQIDLAICWDLKPEIVRKKFAHIDGSHGGEAPAVFSVVHPEKNEIEVASSAQAVAEHIKPCTEEDNVGTLPTSLVKPSDKIYRVTNREAIMECIKPPVNSRSSSFHSLTPTSAEIARKHPKTAWSGEDTSKALAERLRDIEERSRNSTDSKMSNLSKEKHYRSTPNLNGCNGSKCGTDSTNKDKLKNLTSPVNAQRQVKMPKMRPPFQKKSYAISTLIPPFSLWPDHNGQEYPEHWRLASIYQHSYKPIDCRRKPLLASVYQ